MRPTSTVYLLVIGLLFGLTQRATADPYYTVTDLGAPGQYFVNESGQVISVPGQSQISDINDQGDYVGSSNNGYFAKVGSQTVAIPGIPRAINNQGIVLVDQGTGITLFDTHTGLTTHPTFQGNINVSTAFGLNDSGQIVGIGSTPSAGSSPGDEVGFVTQNGKFVNLGAFAPASINNSGQIVGDQGFPGGAHAMLYQDQTLFDLNKLIPPGSGWVLDAATKINASGLIIGNGKLNGQDQAFLLTPAVPVPVPEPGTLVLSTAALFVSLAWKRFKSSAI